MNLIFLENLTTHYRLDTEHPAGRHIRQILHKKPGDSVFVGLPRGPRGLATLTAITDDALELHVEWEKTAPEPMPVHLLIGLPRPQAAKRILRETTTMGIASLTFFTPLKGESNYLQSNIWQPEPLKALLQEGAEQACSTWLPEVKLCNSLQNALKMLKHTDPAISPASAKTRIALDVYEAQAGALGQQPIKKPTLLAIGGERGWDSTERELLRQEGFALAHLGDRVLKSDTATLASAAVILSQLKCWVPHEPLQL